VATLASRNLRIPSSSLRRQAGEVFRPRPDVSLMRKTDIRTMLGRGS
jgi:hypothetical protein